MKKVKTVLFLLIAGLVLSVQSQAAQNAWVSGDEGLVYPKPDTTVEPIHTFKKGEPIRVGNDPKDGWYTVLLPAPVNGAKIGWIESSAILTESQKSQMKASGLSSSRPVSREAVFRRFSLGLDFGMLYLQGSGFQESLGLVKSGFLATLPGAYFMYRFVMDWGVYLRAGLYRYSTVFVGSSELIQSGSYSGSATLIGLGVNWKWLNLQPITAEFTLGAAMLSGATLTTTINEFTAATPAFSSFGVDAQIGAKWGVFSAAWGLYGRLGYLYFPLVSTTVNSGAIEINHSAAQGLAGLFFDF
jgi:hypothetical protein